MFKQFRIHYNDNIFGDILIDYNHSYLIIIFPKISYNLLSIVKYNI